jgi:hypothetical protein
VQFCEKLREKGSILSVDGEDTKAPKVLRGANNVPGNLALTIVARFLPSPKKGLTSFVNSLNNTRREGPRSHSVGDNGGKDRVNKKQATSNGERVTLPPGQLHVALGHNWGKIGEAKFMRRKG